MGSTAYGLATPDSDVDTLGVKLLPMEHFLGLEVPHERTLSQVITDPADITYHDLGKYCRLALSGNPTVTELMWLPKYHYTVIESPGAWLIDNRMEFLSADRVRSSFMGYATAQFKRLTERGDSFSSDTKNRTQKHARHLARLMHQGLTLWSTGTLPIELDDPEYYHAFGRAVAKDPSIAAEKIEEYQEMFESRKTVLPPTPNRAKVEEFVRDTRIYYTDWDDNGAAFLDPFVGGLGDIPDPFSMRDSVSGK